MPTRAVLFLLFMSLAPFPLRGQMTGECDVPSHQGFLRTQTTGGAATIYFRMPVIVCDGGVRITADSAVVYETSNYSELFRSVVFQEGETELTSWRATYLTQERRLRAWGGAVLNQGGEGQVLRGDTMVLERAGPGRPQDRLTVTGRRPQATLYPSRQSEALDSAGAPPHDPPAQPPVEGGPPPSEEGERTPYEIEARRIFVEGSGESRYFRATGAVTIRRDSLNARADSVEYDGRAGALFLSQDAWVQIGETELTARTIRLAVPQDEIREALARDEAVLEGEDLRLLAPILRLFFGEGALERLVAVGDPALDSLPEEELLRRPPHPAAQALGLGRFPLRPHAVAQDYILVADSVEAKAPGDVLEELWAIGDARGESTGRDSLNTPDTPPLLRRDWMEGDTIIATFAPAPDSLTSSGEGESPDPLPGAEQETRVEPPELDPLPREGGSEVQGDTARASYRLERLVARGRARSLYRMEASDSTLVAEGRLAAHYVVGDEITVYLTEGEIDRMEVLGQTRGWHLEPTAQAPREGGSGGGEARPDTTGAPPDTALVRTMESRRPGRRP